LNGAEPLGFPLWATFDERATDAEQATNDVDR
jgi:hypothetical protein